MADRARRGGVKHLNPRQGITTLCQQYLGTILYSTYCVKHLNPRQGITTDTPDQREPSRQDWRPPCETPKSPPGDYNLIWRRLVDGALWQAV